MADATPTGPDWSRIIAALRQGDPEAERMAYRQVFGGPPGRVVLAHMLAKAGVGGQAGPNLTDTQRAYHDGAQDAVLQIAARVGFDQFSAVVAVMTDQLEGQTHDHAQRIDDGNRAATDPVTPD